MPCNSMLASNVSILSFLRNMLIFDDDNNNNNDNDYHDDDGDDNDDTAFNFTSL